jgi:heme/copper-type cytochrome/quinol oxidase subunit 3
MERVSPPSGASVDVSRLPTVVFGSKDLMWWGTMAFIVIEGWTLALTIMAWFYLRQNVQEWPPLRTPDPRLLIPTINLIVMLASLIPAWLAAKAAEKLDRSATTRWLLVSGGIAVVILVLRWFELWSIETRWDTNAYGSVAWLIVGLHATLLLLDAADTIGVGVMFARRELPPHYYTDVTDNTMYWYFTVLSWIPCFLVVYVGPRFL